MLQTTRTRTFCTPPFAFLKTYPPTGCAPLNVTITNSTKANRMSHYITTSASSPSTNKSLSNQCHVVTSRTFNCNKRQVRARDINFSRKIHSDLTTMKLLFSRFHWVPKCIRNLCQWKFTRDQGLKVCSFCTIYRHCKYIRTIYGSFLALLGPLMFCSGDNCVSMSGPQRFTDKIRTKRCRWYNHTNCVDFNLIPTYCVYRYLEIGAIARKPGDWTA